MRGRALVVAFAAIVGVLGSTQVAFGAGHAEYGLACEQGKIMCQDPYTSFAGHYIGTTSRRSDSCRTGTAPATTSPTW